MRWVDRPTSRSIAFVAGLIALAVPAASDAEVKSAPKIGSARVPSYHNFWPDRGSWEPVNSFRLELASGPRKLEPWVTRIPRLERAPTLDHGLLREPQYYHRDVSVFDWRIAVPRTYVRGFGDMHGHSDWSQDVSCGDSCPRTNANALRIAYSKQKRLLDARKEIKRSIIHESGLDALKGRVRPESLPGMLEALSTLIPRARAEERKSNGGAVAVRAMFFPRNSHALDDVPHGKEVLNEVRAATEKVKMKMLNEVKAATEKMKMRHPLVLVFGVASSYGEESYNTRLADSRALTVASELRRELGSDIEVSGVGIYAFQMQGFALDSAQVKQYFRLELLPNPDGDQDIPDAVANQGVIVLVMDPGGDFLVQLDVVDIHQGVSA